MQDRINEMKPSMYYHGAAEFPRLKSKAAETRHLAGALQIAFARLCDGGNEQHKQVKALMACAVRLEKLIDENKFNYKLSASDAEGWRDACQGLVQLTTRLGHYYHPQHILLFHTTIKNHYALHLALIAKHFNPRLGWCYAGEDDASRKDLGAEFLLGVSPPLVVNKVMTKYSRGLSLMCSQDKWRR